MRTAQLTHTDTDSLDRLQEATASRSRAPYGFAAAAYILITAATVPFFMGDTVGYANAIVKRNFSDFGHFLWYPTGWLASRILMPVTSMFVGVHAAANVALTLVILNWFAGLLGVMMLRAVTQRITGSSRAADLSALALVLSAAFLCLSQSGCSYIPGFACLLAAMHFGLKNDDRARPSTALAALVGTLLALSAGFWFTYICSIPAALMAPIVLRGWTIQRTRLAAVTVGACAAVFILVYGVGAAVNHIRSVDAARAWVAGSSHGINASTGNAPRVVFALARSFVNMGNDGALFKAYLAHDPYNPVSVSELLRTSLIKLACFYVFLASILLNALRSPSGRRIVALFALNAAPVLAFALLWEGGAIERYLPLYPAVFITLAHSSTSQRSLRTLKYASIAFVAVMAFANLSVMAKPVQDRREQAVVRRLSELQAVLKPESLVATVNQQDEVWAFRWTFPFDPINLDERVNTYHLIEPSTDRVLTWREHFAAASVDAWRKGGDVWVSTRVQSARPLRDWNWVEGADPNIAWRDVPAFFSKLQFGEVVGSDDGFSRMLPSAQNRAALVPLARRLHVSKATRETARAHSTP